MANFKMGDVVTLKNRIAYAPVQMVVSTNPKDGFYVKCFYFAENKSIQVAEFRQELLELVSESKRERGKIAYN